MRRPLGIFSKSRMPSRSRHVAAAALHLAALSLSASPAFAAWTNVDYGNSGANPTMTLYTPTTPDASPGVIVALHYCGGTATNAQGWFKTLADQYGFLIIAPDVGPGDCWNADPQRAGEPAAIVKMVDYVIDNNSADPNRIFAAGASSGGCMSEALLAAYPDVFAAGAALGVPRGILEGRQQLQRFVRRRPAEQHRAAVGRSRTLGSPARVHRSMASLSALPRHHGLDPQGVDDPRAGRAVDQRPRCDGCGRDVGE